uniref:hypothetical protein n=1 Tax=Methylacidimicrobium tartarophylax TaxID=1041768 RepID=UPI0015B642A8|nr:hypothetical protein [Methylacidimicrobium tartarophylax]
MKIERQWVRYGIAGRKWRAIRDRERRHSRTAQGEELRQIAKAKRKGGGPSRAWQPDRPGAPVPSR